MLFMGVVMKDQGEGARIEPLEKCPDGMDYAKFLRDVFVKNRKTYMIWGDVDKDFHRPECSCGYCEDWRVSMGRPTHKELREMDNEQRTKETSGGIETIPTALL